jgi:uncharacterized RDD family membrane protein YckC
MSMPQGGSSPDQWGSEPQGGAAGNQWGGTPQGGTSQGGQPGQPTGTGYQGDPGAQWRPEWGAGPQSGGIDGAVSPVPVHDTHVTGRRIVQFIIDSILSGIIPSILFTLVRDNTHGVVRGLTWLIAAAVWVVIMVWYWVLRPYGSNGQTFGMKWLGVRVVSKDGQRATMGQMFVRWLGLLLDTIITFFVIVDYIVILCSRYRQRIGDHMAKTIVIRADAGNPQR